MRKLTLMLFAILLSVPAFAQPKVKIEKLDPDSTQSEITTYRTRANHWSLMGSFGVGFLDGDQIQYKNQIWPKTAINFNFLVNVEHTISPIWGIYLEYMYAPYGGKARYVNSWKVKPADQYKTSDEFTFKGMMHELTLGTSLNVLNLFYNCRPQKWQWYLNAGVGGSWYKVTEHKIASSGDNSPYLENDVLGSLAGTYRDGKRQYDATVVVPIGTTVEWNATSWLAVLANMQYRFHLNEDDFDGAIAGNSNDRNIFAGLGLRWKINAAKNKDIYHVRDMPQCVYEPSMAEEIAKKALQKAEEVEDKVNKLEPRVKALEDEVDKLRDSDEDGVPDIRDREPNTPKGVPVNHFGEATPEEAEGGKNEGVGSDNCVSIYFNTGKANSSSVTVVRLADVARRLSADPSLKISINSYADEQGAKRGYNNKRLTEKRAEKTKKILMKEYGVKADRIVETVGHGAVADAPFIDFLPNRRSDICFVK